MLVNALNDMWAERSDQIQDIRPSLELYPKDFGALTPTWTGESINETKAMGFSAWFACVSKISASIAKTPLKTYNRLPKGGREEATKHPAWRLLMRKSNRDHNAFRYKELLALQLLSNGNHYSQVLYNNRYEPNELMPLDPNRVDIQRNKETLRLDYSFIGEKGEKIPLDRASLCHHAGISTDGVKGVSRVTLARQTIALGLGFQQYQAKFLANDATPRGVLEHPQPMDPKAKEKLREEWQKLYGGLRNKHKIGILDAGVAYKQLGLSMQDAEFLLGRKFELEEVARWYGMPPHKIGILDRSTNNNIEQQALEYLVECLDPWLVRIEMELMDVLLKDREKEGMFIEFDREALLQAEIKNMEDALGKRVLTGQISINEARAKRNMNPIEGGDIHLQPLSHGPLGTVKETVKPSGDAKEDDKPKEDEEDSAPDEDKENKERAGDLEVIAPLIKDVIGRAARRESKTTSFMLSKVAKRGTSDEFREWHQGYLENELKPYLRDALDSLTGVANALSDGEEISLDEIVSYWVASSEALLRRATDTNLIAYEKARELLEVRAGEFSEELYQIFFS